MKLIFNAEALRPPITGIGNYTYHLLKQYLSSDLVDDILCFTGSRWKSGDSQLMVTTALKAQDGRSEIHIAEQVFTHLRETIAAIPGTKDLYKYLMDRRFERVANSTPDAVYHETNYILKPYSGPCVTTVHDLSHLRYPQFHPNHVIEWLGRQLPQSLERSDIIITESNLVRHELVEHFGIPEAKLKTIYLGVEECYKPRGEDQTAKVLSGLGLSHKQYVLFVATLEPRKGLDVLLDAWNLLPLTLRREVPLVLTGSTGWHNESLIRRISGLVSEGTVRHLGYVSGEILPILYSGATVFTYPSVYEGFGLPVLEAMSSGLPVICREGTAMAEFSGDASVLCETGEPEELASKLESLLEDQEMRDAIAKKGITQSSQFSWQRCAAETANIYQMISR